MPSLMTPIRALRGIGPALAEKFTALGLTTLQDAIWHIPFRHEDFRHRTTIDQVKVGMDVTLLVTITAIHARQAWRRHMSLTEAKVTDESKATLTVVWFNLPFVSEALKRGDRLFLSGRVTASRGRPAMHNPTFERPSANPSHATLVPIYRTTGGLSQRQIRRVVKEAIAFVELIPEPLPAALVQEYGLMPITAALRDIHFPPDPDTGRRAVDRLKFDELLAWQIEWHRIRSAYERRQAPVLKFDEARIRQFVQRLPFELTNDQRLAAWQIIQDTDRTSPMYRLLQGDVGSGKTIVAALAAYHTVLNHAQAAFLAPTVILAEQHFRTLGPLFATANIPVALLTGAGAEVHGQGLIPPERFLAETRLGKLPLIIATHAILNEHILFHHLGLVIIDEQQRFGVQQRQALLQGRKNMVPHLLSLTATPIPRTLALTLSGQLSVTVMKHKPEARQAIATEVIGPNERARADEAIAASIGRHEQVFIITPRIEEDDSLGTRAVTSEFERIKERFPHARIAIAHGAMKPAERVETMRKFRDGAIDILVATTVIEVGIDVPNATLMVIENADHFGLSQIHQLRGRVGRGLKPSRCFLVTDRDAPESLDRLRNVARLHDGFALAALDLEERGAGDAYGVKQSGLPDWQLATLQDTELMELAARAAQHLLSAGIAPVETPQHPGQSRPVLHRE